MHTIIGVEGKRHKSCLLYPVQSCYSRVWTANIKAVLNIQASVKSLNLNYLNNLCGTVTSLNILLPTLQNDTKTHRDKQQISVKESHQLNMSADSFLAELSTLPGCGLMPNKLVTTAPLDKNKLKNKLSEVRMFLILLLYIPICSYKFLSRLGFRTDCSVWGDVQNTTASKP